MSSETSALDALFGDGDDDDPREAVDALVSARPHEAGVWASPRTSDGVAYLRFLERGPERVRVRGRLWEIRQRGGGDSASARR